MNKEFIPYEQALDLKELGFDEPCFAQYRKYDVGEATLDIGFSKNEIISKFDNLVLFCSTPLYQQAFRWFRDKYKLFHHTLSVDEFRQDVWWECVVYGKTENKRDIRCQPEETYEEAELECLKKLIEIVKTK